MNTFSELFKRIFIVLILAKGVFAGDNTWTSKGPFGGRFTAFAFHPQTNNLIFATAEDGIFRSQDGGKNWKRMDLWDEYPLAAIHPLDPGTIVAAGENAVYSSTDQGATWQVRSATASPFGSNEVTDLVMDPNSPQVLYAASERGSIFKTTDGGRTWIVKNSGLNLNKCCSADPQIEIDRSNGNNLFALINGKFYRTTNAAQSWQSVSSKSGDTMSIDPNNSDIFYVGHENGIDKTTNGGQAWFSTNCVEQTNIDCETYDISVDPKNSRNIYAVGFNVLKSTDGAKTWKQVLISNAFSFYSGVEFHPQLNLVFIGGEGSGIFRSATGGKTWQEVSNGLDSARFVRLHAPGNSSGGGTMPRAGSNQIFAVAESRQPFISLNGGKTWESFKAFGFAIVKEIKTHPKNPSLIAAVGAGFGAKSHVFGERNEFALSKDGGRTWKFSEPEAFDYPRVVAFDPQNENIIYVGDLLDGMSKSTDQGKTWKHINSGFKAIDAVPFITMGSIAVDPQDSSTLYCGTAYYPFDVAKGSIYKSTDGGSSWNKMGQEYGSVNGLAIDPGNSQTVYAATQRGVYKSTDGGKKWALKKSGIGANDSTGRSGFKFVAIDPTTPRIVYAGGAGGTFLSTDSGEKFSNFDSNGLRGPITVRDFLIDPLNTGTSANGENTFSFLSAQRGVPIYDRVTEPGGPIVLQLIPGAGMVGDVITINGSAFGSGQSDSKVFFGPVDAGTAQSWTDTSITVRVPSGTITGPVFVRVASRNSNSPEFIVFPATTIEPSSGPAAGGTQVTFAAPQELGPDALFNILFGSTLAKDVRLNATTPSSIVCTTPRGQGTVDVFIAFAAYIRKIGAFTYQ